VTPVGFEPTISPGELPQTDVLDCAATGTVWNKLFRFLKLQTQGNFKICKKLVHLQVGYFHSVIEHLGCQRYGTVLPVMVVPDVPKECVTSIINGSKAHSSWTLNCWRWRHYIPSKFWEPRTQQFSARRPTSSEFSYVSLNTQSCVCKFMILTV